MRPGPRPEVTVRRSPGRGTSPPRASPIRSWSGGVTCGVVTAPSTMRALSRHIAGTSLTTSSAPIAPSTQCSTIANESIRTLPWRRAGARPPSPRTRPAKPRTDPWKFKRPAPPRLQPAIALSASRAIVPSRATRACIRALGEVRTRAVVDGGRPRRSLASNVRVDAAPRPRRRSGASVSRRRCGVDQRGEETPRALRKEPALRAASESGYSRRIRRHSS